MTAAYTQQLVDDFHDDERTEMSGAKKERKVLPPKKHPTRQKRRTKSLRTKVR